MARNIGLYFLRMGRDVAFWDRDRAWLDKLERRIGKDLKRLRSMDEDAKQGSASFFGPDHGSMPAVDVLIETVEESLGQKRNAIASLRAHLREGGIILTNSSSILPDEIGPGVAGAHFFHPVDLTGFVEAVIPADEQGTKGGTLEFLQAAGFDVIEQHEQNAFAINRLMLPVQNECMLALRRGVPPAIVDKASVSDTIPVGVLSMMDSIGLDTVCSAAGRYVGRMPEDEASDYDALRLGLDQLVAMGKMGVKNRNGLLRGEPLPWEGDTTLRSDFGESLAALFLNTCDRFVDCREIGENDLKTALDGLFGIEYPCNDTAPLEREALLAAGLRDTGFPYWHPLGRDD